MITFCGFWLVWVSCKKIIKTCRTYWNENKLEHVSIHNGTQGPCVFGTYFPVKIQITPQQ